MGKNDCTSSKVQPRRKKKKEKRKKGWGWLGESLSRALSLPRPPPPPRSLSWAGFCLPSLFILNNELILMVAGQLPASSPLYIHTHTHAHTLPPPARLPPPDAAAPDCLVCNNPQPRVPRAVWEPQGSAGSGATERGAGSGAMQGAGSECGERDDAGSAGSGLRGSRTPGRRPAQHSPAQAGRGARPARCAAQRGGGAGRAQPLTVIITLQRASEEKGRERRQPPARRFPRPCLSGRG